MKKKISDIYIYIYIGIGSGIGFYKSQEVKAFFRLPSIANKVSNVSRSLQLPTSNARSLNASKNLSQVKVKKYDLLSKVFFNNIDDKQQEALLMYTFRSRDINRFLSGEKHIKEVFYKDVNGLVKELDVLMNKFNLEDDFTVYKGANRKYFKHLKPGDIFEPKYFFSTSVDKKVAEEFMGNKRNYNDPLLIEIEVPKRSKAIYVGEDTGWKYYKEIILDRNTKYEVLNFDENKLHLRVIND